MQFVTFIDGGQFVRRLTSCFRVPAKSLVAVIDLKQIVGILVVTPLRSMRLSGTNVIRQEFEALTRQHLTRAFDIAEYCVPAGDNGPHRPDCPIAQRSGQFPYEYRRDWFVYRVARGELIQAVEDQQQWSVSLPQVIRLQRIVTHLIGIGVECCCNAFHNPGAPLETLQRKQEHVGLLACVSLFGQFGGQRLHR